MMIGFLYFFVIISANTLGALSGMGGGVLIKPIFDAIGFNNAPTISFYTAVAVFTMSIVSTLRQQKGGAKLKWFQALLISAGALVGGVAGNGAFLLLYDFFGDTKVTLIQIIITIITLVFSIYNSGKGVWHLEWSNKASFVLVGGVLGFLASLLGIGGGPINVSFLMMCFSFPLKEATAYSIVIIFFSQFSKLIGIGVTTGFTEFDLAMLVFIIPAAIAGGWLGGKMGLILCEEKVRQLFQLMIVIVIGINLYNGVQLLIVS